MSVPFSNTNLRIPRGFGTLLEGLTREVLRDQPQDIPTFAANYFSSLLKRRDDKGIDPVEWSTKLEERFHNNNAFKEFTPENQPSEKEPISKENSQTRSEGESSWSEEDTDTSSTHQIISKEVDSSERIMSEEKGCSLEESITNLPGSRELLAEQSEGDKDPTSVFNQLDRAANEKDSSSSPAHELQFELEEALYVHDGTQEQQDSKETGFTEPEGEKNLLVIPDFADVNVCATELGITREATAEQTVEESILESPLPQPEVFAVQLRTHIEAEKSEADDGAETRASSKKTDIFAHVEGEMESDDGLEEGLLDGFPKAQQIAEFEEKPSETEASEEVSQSRNSPVQKREDLNDDTEVMKDQREEVGSDVDLEDEEEASDRLREILLAQDFDESDDDEESDETSQQASQGHTPDINDAPEATVDSEEAQDEKEECSRPQEEEDIMDIPLDDPEANRAAAKIQAGFRGHMTRKKMKPEDKAEVEERQEDRGQ